MSIRSSWLVVFLFFFNLFLLEYSCFIMLCQFLLYSKNESSMHIHPLFWISFPFRLPQSTEQSSLCYTVGSYQLFILYIVEYICQGFPGGSDSKESTCQCRRHRFDPWVGKNPGVENGNPLQYSGLENPGRLQSMGSQRVGHS